MATEHKAIVGHQSWKLSFLPLSIARQVYQGFICYIQILEQLKNSKGTLVFFFSGETQSLPFNPGRWRWDNGKPLMDYSTTVGRHLLMKHHQLKHPIATKWLDYLPIDYVPN